MISHPDFPRLTPANHRVTSPPDPDYNCIAWSAHDTTRWWQPGVYWPITADPDDYGLAALVEGFRSLGYTECPDGAVEPGFEKVALFGSSLLYTHAARQPPGGKWTSKLGGAADIEHETPGDVGGGVYEEVAADMKRPVAAPA